MWTARLTRATALLALERWKEGLADLQQVRREAPESLHPQIEDLLRRCRRAMQEEQE
ncbi:MAG: hypothetical protein HYY16_08775 [Planctomycetes bacterium]|nr:hypothetical protein [Planctomycetota bacterium]